MRAKVRVSDWLILGLIVIGITTLGIGLAQAQITTEAVQVAVSAQRIADLERRTLAVESKLDYMLYGLLMQLGATLLQLVVNMRKRDRRERER